MVDYFQELFDSCKDLYRNPLLFVPFIIEGVVIFAFIALLVAIGMVVGFSLGGFDTFNPVLIVPLVMLSIILIVGVIILGGWFRAGQLGIINQVVEGQRPTKEVFFTTAKAAWKGIIYYGFQQTTLILLGAILPAAFIIAAIYDSILRILWISLAVGFGLLFIVYALLLGVALFFAQPYIIRKQLRAWDAIKASYALLKAKPGFVFASWGVSVLFSVGVMLTLGMLLMPFAIIATLADSPFNFGASIIRVIIQLIVGIILLLYLFRMFKANEPTTVAKKPAKSTKKK